MEYQLTSSFWSSLCFTNVPTFSLMTDIINYECTIIGPKWLFAAETSLSTTVLIRNVKSMTLGWILSHVTCSGLLGHVVQHIQVTGCLFEKQSQ